MLAQLALPLTSTIFIKQQTGSFAF